MIIKYHNMFHQYIFVYVYNVIVKKIKINQYKYIKFNKDHIKIFKK